MSSYTSMPNIALAAQNKSSPLLVKKGIPYYEENSGKVWKIISWLLKII